MGQRGEGQRGEKQDGRGDRVFRGRLAGAPPRGAETAAGGRFHRGSLPQVFAFFLMPTVTSPAFFFFFGSGRTFSPVTDCEAGRKR